MWLSRIWVNKQRLLLSAEADNTYRDVNNFSYRRIELNIFFITYVYVNYRINTNMLECCIFHYLYQLSKSYFSCVSLVESVSREIHETKLSPLHQREILAMMRHWSNLEWNVSLTGSRNIQLVWSFHVWVAWSKHAGMLLMIFACIWQFIIVISNIAQLLIMQCFLI